MMPDQAAELRELVRQAQARERRGPAGPRIIVVCSGKGGVGTSCLAVNFAIALEQLGQRTLFVDADLDGADATELFAAEPRLTIADVLSGRSSVDEAIEPTAKGPALLAGLWGSSMILDCSPKAYARLVEQVAAINDLDVAIVDVGCSRSHLVGDFWQAADGVLAITTPDNAAVMNTYAAIKVFSGRDDRAGVRLVVNQSAGRDVARDVADRITASADRFLKRDIRQAGWLPYDPEVAIACRHREPFVLRSPECPASRAVRQIAESMLGSVLAGPARSKAGVAIAA